MRLNDIVLGAEEGRKSEAFWANLFDQGLQQAIQGCLLACQAVDIEAVSDIIAQSPVDVAADAAFQKWLSTSFCAKMLTAAENRVGNGDRRYKRVYGFFMNEVATIGHKARGALLSMNNGLLSKFTASPFYEAFSEGPTTLTPEIIEQGRLIVALDADVLTYGLPGRMFQLAWIMLMQGYGLRRDARKGNRIIIGRDEAANFTHPGYDALVAAVARSQKVLHFDLFQDFDLIESTYGGGPKAKNEALSWWANHGVKVMFRQNNPDSCEIQSRLVGDKREFHPGGGGGQDPNADWMSQCLGATQSYTWHSDYQRIYRPEFFSRLQQGQCVLVADGRHWALDLWEGR